MMMLLTGRSLAFTALFLGLLSVGMGSVTAHAPARDASSPAAVSAHAQKDIQRHRAMAQAHEAAARCLEAGKDEKTCQRELAQACKGLALGRYCGMRHEH